jgi:hypothetical protein
MKLQAKILIVLLIVSSTNCSKTSGISIAGTWKYTGFKASNCSISSNNVTRPACNSNCTVFTFTSSSFTEKNAVGTVLNYGTYSISGNSIKINWANSGSETDTFTLSGNTLTIINLTNGCTNTITMTKQ